MKKLTKKIMYQLLTTGEITEGARGCFDEDEQSLVVDILNTRVGHQAVALIYEIIEDREELRPCPFCGNKEAPRYIQELDVDKGWFVICDAASDAKGCGAKSGWGVTPAMALGKWNKRI